MAISIMKSKKEHWENVFATKKENEVSWYQQKPEISINFFNDHQIPKDAKIIDIGGGDSYLIDSLLDLGYTNLFLLDISENAIERIKNRLGEKGKNVTFITSDILEFNSEITFDVWHDRASFHFLTTENEINTYQKLVSKNISSNGYLFIGTFSENGPTKCSGLEISQYSEQKCELTFGENFSKTECFTENHQTPFNTIQNFIFCIFRKK